MGELIAFKPASCGVRARAAPAAESTVVVFTGLWQERPKDTGAEAERPRPRSGRRPRKSAGKTKGGLKEQNPPQI
jgi:hypothetical protein